MRLRFCIVGKKFFNNRITPIAIIYFSRALLALLPLVSLPLFLRILGSDDWTQLVLFQTLGAVLSLIVDLAWSIDGHGKDLKDSHLIHKVQIQKYALYLSIGVITVPLSMLLEGSVVAASWLGMLATASMGLSNWWHWLAVGELRRYLLNELLPRVLPLLVLLLFVKNYLQVNLYLTFFILLNMLFCWRKIGKQNRAESYPQILKDIVPRLELVFWRVLQSSYFLFGLPILAIIKPSACFGYALAERIYRFSMTATLPLQDLLILRPPKGTSFLKSWKSMALFQPMASGIIFLILCHPKSFKIFFGIENPDYFLTLFFLILVILVSINRVLLIRFTKIQFKYSSLKQMYLTSTLVFLLFVYPLTTFLGPYGMVLSSALAELSFLIQFNRNRFNQTP